MSESLSERTERLRTGGRLREIDLVLTDVEAAGAATEGDFSALVMLLLDAVRDGDEFGLELAYTRLQRLYGIWDGRRTDDDLAEQAGRIRALADVAGTALEQVVPLDVIGNFEPESNAHRFLRALEEEAGLSNTRLGEVLDADPAEISRIGRRLHDAGLARKRRYGRRNAWDITPRGLKALDVLERGEFPRYHRPHRAPV